MLVSFFYFLTSFLQTNLNFFNSQAKLELNHVRNMRDSLKLNFENAEQDLISRNHVIENLNKSFQIERQNNNIKIKYFSLKNFIKKQISI